MVQYGQMKSLASITALILSACAHASPGVAVPPSDFVDAEAATNVVFDAGDVYGVYYTEDDNRIKTWHKNCAPVGFPWSSRNAVHQ